jgi:methyl-accepting chemotaxis protein
MTLPIKTRLLVCLVIVLAALAIISWMGYVNTSSIAGKSNSLYEDQTLPVQTLSEIRNISWEIMQGAIVHSAVFDNEKMNEQEQHIETFSANLASLVEDYKRQTGDFDGSNIFAEYQKHWDRFYKTTAQEALTMSRNFAKEDAMASLVTGGAQQDFSNTMASINDLVKMHSDQMQILNSESIKQVKQVFFVFLTLSCAMGAVVFFIMSWVIRSIVKPLELLSVAMGKVKDEKDLTVSAKVESQDEIGQIIDAFNSMLESISSALSQVVGAYVNQDKATNSVLSIAQKTRTQASNQQREINQVASSITEVASSITEVANNAKKAADSAAQADQSVSRGKTIIFKTVDSISNLAKNAQDASGVLENLVTESDKVAGVMDVIRSIADQTNLLALNAAIEAARAGEMGRGFAVVADEVRSLAQRTQTSTQEIEDMVVNLQEGTKRAGVVINRGLEEANVSMQSAEETGKAFEDIIDAVNTIKEMNSFIADTAHQQADVIESISENTENINVIASESTISIEDTEKGCREVAGYSEEVKTLLSAFKTG